MNKKVVKVCKGGTCSRCFSSEVKKHLEKHTDCSVEDTGCMGDCDNAPNIKVDEKIHTNVTPQEAARIVQED